MSNRGIGASITRKEDDRFLRGRGQFVRDIQIPGMWNAAFMRSPVAHARIKQIKPPEGSEGRVFSAADLVGMQTIRAVSTLPGYKSSDFPVLATDKVRYVGQPIAACVAPTRAEAEDLAEAVTVKFEPLPAVTDLIQAMEPGAPLVHEPWGDNIFHEGHVDVGDIESVKKQAAHAITREHRLARQVMMPMEQRGVVAHYNTRLDELTCHISCQMPHVIRTGLARFLNLDHRRVRVIAPDIGGGFGLKIFLEMECLVTAWLAMHLKRPVRWIEDCFEHLIADANCREHAYRITYYSDDRGKLLGLDAELTVDGGAYANWPWTSLIDAAQGAGIMLSAYDVKHYRSTFRTVATNKPPIVVYRGVARTGVCFATELTLDAVARAVGREPYEVRIDNMIRPEQMPYMNATRKQYDSGDYPASVRKAAELVDLAAVRARQKTAEPDGRRIGVGFSTYTEQTGHGTSVLASWGCEIVPGYEEVNVRMTPDGDLIIEAAVQPMGQGLETTLAQVACEVLGLDPSRIACRFGDSSKVPYGTGSYASRSMIMAGGAVAQACRILSERIAKIGAHLLQASVEQVTVENGEVKGPGGSVGFDAIGRAWYLHPEELPPDVDQAGLTVSKGHRPDPDSGAFSYATHAAVVAVDSETGEVEIIDYAIVHDCGTPVNPLIVDGQVIGGTAQGIGTALYEEAIFDAAGQPQHGTLADYMIPGATEMPEIKLDHMISPSPWTEFGIKGLGEGGAIAPPAAIANAVNDALKDLGVEILQAPLSPRRVAAAIQAAAAA